MSNITASKLDLARHCPGAFALPQVNEANAYQEAGNERDAAYSARILAVDVPEELASRWPGAKWRTQVKFAYNYETDTGRELPEGSGHRDYSSADPLAEICGSADVIGELPGLVIVGDKKSFDPNVPRAAVNGQVHIAALAIARARGLERADVFIDHEARAFDVASLFGMDLDAFALDARAIVREAFTARARHRKGESLKLATGPWCRWCNAFNACPKQKELKALVTSDELALKVEGQLPFIDDQQAADGYDLWKKLGILYKRLGEALHARAAERPIALSNGNVFAKIETAGKRSLDGDKAYALIREKFGQEIADKAVSREATQTGIKAALGKESAVKAIVDELEKLGGVTRKPSTKFEELPAAKLLKAGGQ